MPEQITTAAELDGAEVLARLLADLDGSQHWKSYASVAKAVNAEYVVPLVNAARAEGAREALDVKPSEIARATSDGCCDGISVGSIRRVLAALRTRAEQAGGAEISDADLPPGITGNFTRTCARCGGTVTVRNTVEQPHACAEPIHTDTCTCDACDGDDLKRAEEA